MRTQWKLASQRGAFAKALVELGTEKRNIVVLSADLSSSVKTSVFAEKFPERFFNIGIAEQNMMSIAAGFALCGNIVFASTFAVFGTGRVYDQIRQSIAYPSLNVKIVASHAGITVGGDGATHQITEDITLMCALPNMSVVVPADSIETAKAVKRAADHDGPVYIRMGRVDVPTITNLEDSFEIGKATTMLDGNDVTLIGTGIMVAECLEAAELLQKKGLSTRVINMSTIKPIDKSTIIKAANETGAIVSAEEHSILGGLGSTIASVLVENVNVPMKFIGIPDVFGESGESEELMVKYGLTADNIVNAALEIIKNKR